MENCPYCGAPGSYREAVDGCCYVCGMMLPQSQGAAEPQPIEISTEASADLPIATTETDSASAATIQLQPPPYVPPVEDTIEPPAIKLIQPRNLSPEYARRVTAAWQATKSPFQNPQETLNSGASTAGDATNLFIGSRSVASAGEDLRADYELKEVIGEGNMGTVWAARQASLDRQVAVKVPKRTAAASSLGRELFVSEVVVTGQLDHPNIVPIYDLARDESGQLFYAMKRVEGRSWDQCMHEEGRTRIDNVEILMKVCDAIRFAHDRGVIHRDIKPQNIMVGQYGEVAVMDWGIALRIDQQTRMPGVAKLSPSGTPAYMAPEMATGNASDLGPHTDVYLLGAVLYEIITGEPPHPAPDPSHDAFVQQNACLLIAARNVITPAEETGELIDIAYKAMATDISDRFQTVDEFQSAIRDYYSHSESIVLTDRGQDHLTKAAEARNGVYEDYNKARFAFGEALQLWPENTRARSGLAKATLEHAGTALQRGDYALGLSLLDRANPTHADLVKKLTAAKRKSDRNHFVAFASLVAAACFLILGIAGVSIFAWRESAAKKIAETEKLNADQARIKAEASEKSALASEQKAIVAREAEKIERKKAEAARIAAEASEQKAITAREAEEIERKKAEAAARAELIASRQAQEASYRSEIGLAAEEVRRNAFDSANAILLKQAENETQASLRNWEWGHLMFLAKDPSIARFDIGDVARVEAVALSPDQKWITAGTDDGKLHVWWRPDTNTPPRKLLTPAKENSAPISALAISRDSRLLASAGGNEVHFYNLPAGDPGRGIAPAGDPLQYPRRILSVALSPNAETVLTSADDSTAQLWSRSQPNKPLHVLRGHLSGKVWQARFSPDGDRIVTVGDDEIVRLWDAQGNELRTLAGHQGPVYTAEFSPDGNYVVSGGRDRRLLIWDLNVRAASQSRTETIRQRLATTDDISQNGHLQQLGEHSAAVRSIAFSPDAKTLYSASDDNSLRVWDIAQGIGNGQLVKSLRGHGGWVRSCSPAADGEHVLSGAYDGQVYLWDWTKYAFPRVLRPESERTLSDIRFTAAAASPDSPWIATAAEDGTVAVWDMANPLNPTSQLLREGHDWQATTGVYFRQGSRLLTAAGDNSALVWDTGRGNQLLRIGGWNRTGGTGWRGVAAVAHHGRSIATGSDEAGILAKLWDAQSGRLIASLAATNGAAQQDESERAEATAIAFAPDDATLFVGDQWGRCYLFRTVDGSLMKSFFGHNGKINAALFLPNGRLLTAGSDATVIKWNIPSDQSDPQAEGNFEHGSRVVALDVARDGKQFITAADSDDDEAVLRVWDAESGTLVDRLTFSELTGISDAKDLVEDKPAVRSVALRPNGSDALVTLFDPRLPDYAYRLGKWEWKDDANAVQWISTRLRDTSMAMYTPNSNGAILTVGGRGARLRFANQPMSYRPQSRVQSVAFSPDSRLLASAGDDGSIKLWRFEADRWLPEQKLLGGHQGPVNSVAFHPLQADMLLSAGDDGAVKLWQRGADGWNPHPLGGENARLGPVRQAIFAPLGENETIHVLTAADNDVKVWTLAGQPMGTLAHDRPVQAVAVSPDRKWIVTGVGSEAWIWNAAAGQEGPTQKLGGHSAEITSLAFSPDGHRLFTASRDFTVKLWDTAPWNADGGAAPSSRELLTLEQHRDNVVAVSYFANPTYPSLLTAGADGQAILWPSVSWGD